MLEAYFDDHEMRRMFRTIATDPVVRAILEFKELDVVPYEDFKLLEERGLVERYDFFQTYVPIARGMLFHNVRLTLKGRHFRVQEEQTYEMHQLCYESFSGYCVRHTGQGVVANREAIEQWLDEGRTELLRLLVDPMSGQSLGDVMADWENFLEDASDSENREEMIAERLEEEVNEPVSKSWEIYEPTKFTDEIL
ncbi:MAG: hypothetical protein ABJ327_01100 [Litoreibacter sp.]